MSRRSIFSGILFGALLCAVTYFNDIVLQGTFLIGSYMPLAVVGGLILLVLFVNPLLGRISRRAAFSGSELAVLVAIAFFVSAIPGRGLMHHFTALLMMPRHYERIVASWQGDAAEVTREQVSDWDGLLAALAGAGRRAESDPLRRLWERAPGGLREGIRNGTVSAANARDRAALIEALNSAIADPAFHAGLPVPDGAPAYIRILADRDPSSLLPRDHGFWNRGLIESALGECLEPRLSGALENVPARMLAEPGQGATRALDGFITGLARGDESIAWRDIPWRAWRGAFSFWIPLILTVCLLVTGLALVLHRQWSSHEHLPYPTIEFVRALLPEQGRLVSAVFRNRLFWMGAGVVLVIHMSNYLAVWWPAVIIPVKTTLDLTPLAEIFTFFERGGAALFKPTLYFTAIGFAYFLAGDVGFSLGGGPYLYAVVLTVAAGYGVSLETGNLAPSNGAFLQLGGFFGLFVAVALGGRHYYKTAFARGLGLPARDAVEAHAVWGARLFLAALAAFVAQLTLVGVDWQVGLLYAAGLIVIFTALSRLLAEAGVFCVATVAYPCTMLWGLMGAAALGRSQLLTLSLVSVVFLFSASREAMMPFVMSAFQLGDRAHQRLGAVARWGLAAVVVGLLVAVPATLIWQYRLGVMQAGDRFVNRWVVPVAFHDSATVGRTIAAQGALRVSESLHGWQRFAHLDVAPSWVAAFAVTFLLVLLFRFLRHRFAWWPLHPLILVVLGTAQIQVLAFSFLLGWAFKRGVTTYGGAALYHRLKPLMFGLVAGEVLAGLAPVLVGAIYHQVTGDPPRPFRILP